MGYREEENDVSEGNEPSQELEENEEDEN